MPQLSTSFNIDAVDAASLPILQLKQFIIASQSVPAGTIIPEGATIGVQISTISNLPLGSVDHTLPVEIGSLKVGDINAMMAAQPTLLQMASDPAVLTDANKRSAFVNAANAAAGKSLATDANAEAMTRVILMMGR